jgi:hypothetical protein
MNNEILRKIFSDSLDHLGLSLIQATDWINSRLEEGKAYKYEQLYRFSRTGLQSTSARKKVDQSMVKDLARIEFWWDEKNERPYTEEGIFHVLMGTLEDYNKPQLNLLELEEVNKLVPLVNKLSPVGRSRLLEKSSLASGSIISTAGKPARRQVVVHQSQELEFYKLRNWMIRSLERLGRPNQPRTAAKEQGFQGRIGENLNLLIEGDRSVNLTRDDYIAASFILFKVRDWTGTEPIFADTTSSYRGDWQGMLLDLRYGIPTRNETSND